MINLVRERNVKQTLIGNSEINQINFHYTYIDDTIVNKRHLFRQSETT